MRSVGLDQLNQLNQLRQSIESVIRGKAETVEMAVVTLLAGGHLLVEDVQAWRDELVARDLAGRYCVKIGPLVDQPWRMRDFFLYDPSGVLWLIAQNTD